jgi:predicted transcriptional regulator
MGEMMTSMIITKGLVRRYVSEHPRSTPVEIAQALDAPISSVNKKLLKLLNTGALGRTEEKYKLDSMYYFPLKRELAS